MTDNLRVLVAGPDDGATATYLLSALRRAGAKCLLYPYRQYYQTHGIKAMNEDFASAAQEYDLTLVLKGEVLHPKVVEALTQHGHRVAVWNLDPWLADEPWVLNLARAATRYFTIAKGHVARLRSDGVDAHWLLEACDPATHRPFPSQAGEPVYPVSFVGTIQDVAGRTEWIQGLREALGHENVHLFGSHPGSLTERFHGRAEQACGLEGDAGLSWVVSHSTVNLGRDRCPSVERSYGARLFRTLSAQGYLLTNSTVGLLEDFAGCLDAYTDLDDCIRLARRALERPDHCRRVARRGYKEVRARHTFDHRVKEILRVVGI